jgi:2-C-methyl-D-erythritol 4-phosphate cytidylyltransferase
MLHDNAVAVVLAAGVGSRIGDDMPKQFLDLNGVPVLIRTVIGLAWCGQIVVVHHPQYLERTRRALANGGFKGGIRLVPGGSTRRQSVVAALEAVSDLGDDVPLILQNAASPNTPRRLVTECLNALQTHDVAQAYVPAVHTIIRHEKGELSEVLTRNKLGYSVDPTVYRLGCLRRIADAQAEVGADGEMTLDTARSLDIRVRLVPSPESNVKLTTPNDFAVLRAVITAAKHEQSAPI